MPSLEVQICLTLYFTLARMLTLLGAQVVVIRDVEIVNTSGGV